MSNNNSMPGLSNELIEQLLAQGRDRNLYGPKIVEFEKSGLNGVDVMEHWPIFATKVSGGMKINSIVLGFRKAASDAKVDWLVVKALDNHVFLINTSKVVLTSE
jgi:hypothetical protein